MNLVKRAKIISTIFGSFALAQNALAQEPKVEMEKQPLKNAYTNLYGKSQVRHLLSSTDQATVDASYTLGTLLFDKKLESELTFGLNKQAKSTEVNWNAITWESKFNAYSNNSVAIFPYLNLEKTLKTEDKASETTASLGLNVPFTYIHTYHGGTIKLGSSLDSSVLMSSSKTMVPVNDEKGQLALTDSGESRMAEAESLNTSHEAAASITVTPSTLSELSLEWKTSHRITGKQAMQLNENNEAQAQFGVMGLPVYDYTGKTEHRLRTKYQLSDTVYLQNDFILQNATVEGKSSYKNKFGIVATLL